MFPRYHFMLQGHPAEILQINISRILTFAEAGLHVSVSVYLNVCYHLHLALMGIFQILRFFLLSLSFSLNFADISFFFLLQE